MCNLNVLLLILLAPCLAAAPGDLDTTFNTNGFVLEDISAGGADRANALAVQPDGRIVVVGARDFGGSANFWIVARYNTDGSLDTLKLFPRARVVVRETNGGFSKACNTGIAAANWKIPILPQFRRQAQTGFSGPLPAPLRRSGAVRHHAQRLSTIARAGRWMAGKRDIGVMAGHAPPRTPLRSRLDWPAFFISGNPPAACSPPRGGIAGDRGKDRGRKSGTGFPPAAKGGKAKRPTFYFLFPEITTVSFPFLVLTSTLPSPGPELPA